MSTCLYQTSLVSFSRLLGLFSFYKYVLAQTFPLLSLLFLNTVPLQNHVILQLPSESFNISRELAHIAYTMVVKVNISHSQGLQMPTGLVTGKIEPPCPVLYGLLEEGYQLVSKETELHRSLHYGSRICRSYTHNSRRDLASTISSSIPASFPIASHHLH